MKLFVSASCVLLGLGAVASCVPTTIQITIDDDSALDVPSVARRLPACSGHSRTPCACPAGTTYEESSTWAVIGAPATDVRELTSSFFHTVWQGDAPDYEHTGEDYTPGATRTLQQQTIYGVYTCPEVLTDFQTRSDGSYIQKFEMIMPDSGIVPYHSGKGALGGWWITMEAHRVFQNETAMNWRTYACTTDHAMNYASFHEGAILNAIELLKNAGKVVGLNVPPGSTQLW